MDENSWELPEGLSPDLILEGVSTLFSSLGRALICLGDDFHVVHASAGVDSLAGEGARKRILGVPIERVLGEELLGPESAIRAALLSGETREGWGATLRAGEGKPRLVSLTAAPIQHAPDSICDPRVHYIVVLRPAEDDQQKSAAAPTIFSGIVARSASMLKIFELIQHLSESDATVLITGESGTGKELVARAIHIHSHRARGPFLPVNCGALPQDLLESELFGHVKGAFTGAIRDRAGRFEVAEGGTILLDEVAEMPLHLQVKLLRVLQERTFERVGESTSRTTDARLVAATNRDLRQAVLDGEFRDDLYYRLRVVPIEVPPLRDRREDIEPLAFHLLNRVSRRHDRAVRLSNDSLRALLRYDWPGNVRELENALEYAVAVSKGQTIHLQDLPVEVADVAVASIGEETAGVDGQRRVAAAAAPLAADAPSVANPPPAAGAPPPTDVPFPSHTSLSVDTPPAINASPPMTASGEPERIRAALDAHRWNRADAADALGISRTTLWRKMREHGLLS